MSTFTNQLKADNHTQMDVKSLIERYNRDIAKFRDDLKQEELTLISKDIAFNNYNTIVFEMQEISKICEDIKEMLGIVITGKIGLDETFNYHEKIKDNTITPLNKRILWILRNMLFYRILIDVVKEQSSDESIPYRIGVFGSNNVTSDIDGTLTCNSYNKNNKPSVIIKAIEDKFVNIVGIPSLAMDIELYCSFLYFPDCETNEMKNFFNFNGMTNENYDKLFKYAWTSVMLNNRKKDKPIDTTKLTSTLSGILKNVTQSEKFANILPNENDPILKVDLLIEIPKINYKDIDAYNKKREKYYECIDDTYVSFLTFYEECLKICDETAKSSLTPECQYLLIDFVEKLAKADSYREEGYLLLVSVMIIVHMIQTGDTNCPINDLTKQSRHVACGMDANGYKLCLIEQLGEMNLHTDERGNPDDKYDKYKKRAQFCVAKIVSLQSATVGGKKIRGCKISRKKKCKKGARKNTKKHKKKM